MTARDHDQHSDNLAPWLLGALSPLESEVFERHLAGCDVCQREAERLRPAIGALATAAPEVEPPRELKAALMETVRAEARERSVPATPTPRRRFWPALRPAAALAMVAVGVVIGVSASQVSDDEGRTIAAAVDRTRVPTGTAELHVGDGDARLVMHDLPDPGRGKVWEVWIQHGERLDRGPVTEGDEVRIPGGVEGADAVLVTREPAPGVDKATEAPVMKFELS